MDLGIKNDRSDKSKNRPNLLYRECYWDEFNLFSKRVVRDSSKEKASLFHGFQEFRENKTAIRKLFPMECDSER